MTLASGRDEADSAELPEDDRAARVEAIVRRELGARVVVTVLDDLVGGHTNATVARCDLMGADPGGPDGHFIMKVTPNAQDRQHDAHRGFADALGAFAEAHVPKLYLSACDDRLRVDIYEIAGGSVRGVRPADIANSNSMVEACAEVSRELLEAQFAGCTGGRMSVLETLEAWFGKGFPSSGRGDALRETRSACGIARGTFALSNRVLPDPLSVLDGENELTAHQGFVLQGRSHGDLHLRNILLDDTRSSTVTYWLIDVNWEHPSPLLYDQAYLETAALLAIQDRLGKKIPLEVLLECDEFGGTVEIQWQGFVSAVRSVRRGKDSAIANLQRNRRDSLDDQYLLARLGAALNFASKKMPMEKRIAAYELAGWVTSLILAKDYGELQTRVLMEPPNSRSPSEETSSTTAAAGDIDVAAMALRIQPFLADTHSGHDRFLIVEDGVDDAALANLLTSRWSVIVDLNPHSDERGLALAYDPEEAEQQAVMFGCHEAPAAGSKTASWVMAAGWESRGEHAPDSFVAWRRTYLPIIRTVLERRRRLGINGAAAIVCLTEGAEPNERTVRVLNIIEELYEQIETIDAARDGAAFRAVLEAFADAGAIVRPDRLATLPGENGPVRLTRERLARLSADLIVLHSRILGEDLRDEPVDQFWRGRPPSWLDLEAGLDLPRHLQPALQEPIAEVLRRHSSTTYELFHTPGAGGTTLARRVAWDLHRTFPVVLLRSYSLETVERLDEIYRLTGQSVLLVAESADMGQSEREDFYRKLIERNTPVVTLWVTRRNKPGEVRSDNVKYLSDPMTSQEVADFRRSFAPRAVSPKARAAVEALSLPGVAFQQLSPFFFGLSAFEQEFLGTASYVNTHVDQLDDNQRRVAGYLALVTRYAQHGLPYSLVRRWLTGEWGGGSASSAQYQRDLAEVLGADLRHLVVEDAESLRILHPYVAERLLDAILEAPPETARWAVRLADMAVEFIGQVVGQLGPENEAARTILEDLFIRRDQSAGSARTQRFADLIVRFGVGTEREADREQAYRILRELTRKCPMEPHFWLHRGRYHLSYKKHTDGKAQQFIEKAIELSAGQDPLHFHALGMLHRDVVRDELSKVGRGSGNEVSAIVRVRVRYDEALRVFTKARRLNPDDEHNYVTAVQMIVKVLSQLITISRSRNLMEFLQAGGPAAEWADAQLFTAVSLLDQCESARPENLDSSYLSSCRTEMDVLHGEVAGMIKAWRDVILHSRSHSGLALALARQFLRDQGDNWGQLPVEVFRSVVELYDAAFEEHGDLQDHDVELWFRCYRRLPEYDDLAAFERFSLIAESRVSPLCSYYRYVLHFLRWLNRDELFQEKAARCLLDASQKLYGRKQRWSYEWVAKGEPVVSRPTAAQLGYFKDLGEYRASSRDWERSEEVCRRVRGVIRRIDGPKSGSIAVEDGEMEAFFQPREDFLKHAHLNKVVEFDLGFAQDGLRAWRVKLASTQALFRNQEHWIDPVADEVALTAYLSTATPETTDSAAELDVMSVPDVIRAEALRRERIDAEDAYRFVIEFLLSRARNELDVTSLKAGEFLNRTFGETSYKRMRGNKLRDLILRLGFDVRRVSDDGRFAIVARPVQPDQDGSPAP